MLQKITSPHGPRRTTISGFTIIELLFAVSIATVLMMSSASLFNDLSTTQNTHNFRTNADAVANEVRQLLRDQTACTSTLGGTTLDGSTNSAVTNIRDRLNNPVYVVADSYNDRSVRLASVTASNYADLVGPRGRLALELQFDSPKAVKGSQTLSRTIQLNTVKDGTNALANCAVVHSSNESPWLDSAASPGDIYTMTQVGIGTDTPAQSLDVKGGLIHGQLNCRTVVGLEFMTGSTVTCDLDEYVVSGGGNCTTIAGFDNFPSFMHESRPLDDLSGWRADCYGADHADDSYHKNTSALVTGWAICCKK